MNRGDTILISAYAPIFVLCFRHLLERMTAREIEILDDTEGPENCSLTLYRTNEDGKLDLAYYNRVVWE